MIQMLNNIGNILGHIAVDIVFTAQKLRRLVYQICRQHLIKNTLLICLIKLFQSVRKQTKCRTHKDFSCTAAFEILCYINHTVTGRNHVVNDQQIFSAHIAAQKLMRHDRITTVDDPGIVAPLVEHTHINTQVIGHIDGTGRCTFIRADNHQMFGINRQIRHMI